MPFRLWISCGDHPSEPGLVGILWGRGRRAVGLFPRTGPWSTARLRTQHSSHGVCRAGQPHWERNRADSGASFATAGVQASEAQIIHCRAVHRLLGRQVMNPACWYRGTCLRGTLSARATPARSSNASDGQAARTTLRVLPGHREEAIDFALDAGIRVRGLGSPGDLPEGGCLTGVGRPVLRR
jgi:hypothetical protein